MKTWLVKVRAACKTGLHRTVHLWRVSAMVRAAATSKTFFGAFDALTFPSSDFGNVLHAVAAA
jgi:hypothetical protein